MRIKKTIPGSNIKGIVFLILALFIISIQSVAVKWLGGSYPVLEMVVLRNIIALPFTLFFYYREGKKGLPKTRLFRLEIIRGLFLFFSYTCFMMGLVALPLAQVESIRFSGPLMITILSILLLGEKVPLLRWPALAVGFFGVLLIVKPNSAKFNMGTTFILFSVFFYALTVIATRKLQNLDSSATMAFYSSLVYLSAALIITPVTLAVGEIPGAHPSIAFLLHDWVMPSLGDGLIMCSLGLVWASWSYFMTLAYSLAKASVVAPFEYLSLPINSFWGFLFWQEIPSLSTITGSILILSGGFLILYMDRNK